MPNSASPEDMSPVELHGIQLRMASDALELGTFVVHARTVHAIDQAEGLLEEVNSKLEDLS